MDKTIIEDSKTAIDNDITILDTSTNATVLEDTFDTDKASETFTLKFKDYTTVKQLPTVGAEADIYIIEKNAEQFILKLYRHEMKPSRDMIDKLVNISNQYTEDIIRIYEIDIDKKLNRWYEIQEYAKFGTLKDLRETNYDFAITNINRIIEEVTLLLKTIHNENIIHRDIKPDNILIRKMRPLDLIITDFGISSVLDEEMSKKMTSKSGTRIYFAPESFSGVIGNEVDYWALGMIILEILEDGNIFSNINEGMIAHEIFTKGVKIPSNIDNHLQLLLKGLLTRDPKKRWNYVEIFKWLDGDTNIATYYSYSDNKESNIKAYTFANEEFDDLENLLIKLYSEEYYENCKEHIMRGYVTKWLENNDMLDDAILIDKYKSSSENIDLNIFKIFNNYVKPEKFIFMGKLITVNNLAKFIGDLVSENTSDFIDKIYDYLSNDTLINAYDNYILQKPKDEELYILLKQLKFTKNITEAHYLLRIYLEKDLAYAVLQNETANNTRIKNGNVKKLHHSLDENIFTLPQFLIDDIKNKKADIIIQNNYLKKNEINKFLENKELFGFDNLNFDYVIQNKKVYNLIQNIVNRNINENNFNQYAYVYKMLSSEEFKQKIMNVLGEKSDLEIDIKNYQYFIYLCRTSTYSLSNGKMVRKIFDPKRTYPSDKKNHKYDTKDLRIGRSKARNIKGSIKEQGYQKKIKITNIAAIWDVEKRCKQLLSIVERNLQRYSEIEYFLESDDILTPGMIKSMKVLIKYIEEEGTSSVSKLFNWLKK